MSLYLINTVIIGLETETLKRLKAIIGDDWFRTAITTVIFLVCLLRYRYAIVKDYYNKLSSRYRYSKEKLLALE